MVYFSFASNMDEAQMRRRCPGAVRGARAFLHDYKLTFRGFSAGWGGAVASVVPAPGSSVPGLLYHLGPDDLAALDEFEGHPLVYERVQCLVVDEQGRRRRVHLYLQTEAGFGAPAPRYYAVLRRAYARLGFDPDILAAAAGVAA